MGSVLRAARARRQRARQAAANEQLDRYFAQEQEKKDELAKTIEIDLETTSLPEVLAGIVRGDYSDG